MNGQQKTLKVAVALIFFSMANLAFSFLLAGGAGLGVNAIGLLFAFILAVFLAKGENWSRIITIALSTISAVLAIISLSGLLGAGASPFTIYTIWMLLSIAFYAWVCFTLLADKDVIAHFKN